MKKLAGVFFLLLTGQIFAGTAYQATITEVMMDKNIPNSVFIKVSAAGQNNAACNTNSSGFHFVIYDDTQTGKNMLAVLLTAYTTGVPVDIIGDNYCSNEVEKLARLFLKK